MTFEGSPHENRAHSRRVAARDCGDRDWRVAQSAGGVMVLILLGGLLIVLAMALLLIAAFVSPRTRTGGR